MVDATSHSFGTTVSSFLVQPFRAFAWVLLFSVAIPHATFAHNMGEVTNSLRENERYMQPMNEEAPSFDLEDPDGNRFVLEDFRGKVVVLNFLYSRCVDECPLHSVKIAEAQQQIAEASLADQVQFLTIATDTESGPSTAVSMRDHGSKFGLDPGNWKFLFGGTGGERIGLGLAEAYGLKFVPTEAGQQMHGVVTFVIDSEGWLRAKFHGLGFATTNLTIFAAALAHGEHRAASSAAPVAAQSQSDTVGSRLRPSDWIGAAVGIASLVLLAWFGYSHVRKRKWKLPL